MDKKIIKFNDTEIEEYRFHQHKIPLSINNININKIVVSNKLPFGKQNFKYFIGCKGDEKIRPLYIFRQKMGICKIYFDKTKCMYFLIKDEKKIDKYNEIWGKC